MVLSFIVSSIFSIRIKRNFQNYIRIVKKFAFYGSKSEFKSLNKLLDNNDTKFKYDIKLLNLEEKLDLDFNGIIFSKKTSNYLDFKYFIKEGFRSKVNVYSLEDWLENNLNRIPHDYINFEKFVKKYNFY